MEIGLDVGARLPLIFVIIIKDHDWDNDDCDLMVMMTQHNFDIGDCDCVNWADSDCEDTDDDSSLINHIFWSLFLFYLWIFWGGQRIVPEHNNFMFFIISHTIHSN